MARSRLLVISAMPHHRRGGQVVGWAPTVRELDHLSTRFTTVRHIACLYEGVAPETAIPYSAANLELVPVAPSGAEGFLGKLDVIKKSPAYVRAILRELPDADMIHVRGPAQIALIAMVMLTILRRPAARWFKYAGNWQPTQAESPSYTFQRWWLSRAWHGGVVTVSGDWPTQPQWIRPFYNPSLEREDIVRGRAAAAEKRLGAQVRLLYVGRIEARKGAARAVEVVRLLQNRNIDATLDLLGDGAARDELQRHADANGLAGRIRFRGWQSPASVREAYAHAHLLLLPTASEGWPKVLSEGMAYGVVPVAGAVSAIPQYLGRLGTGCAIAPDDVEGFARAVASYLAEPDRWQRESARAVEATAWFSYDHYLAAIDQLLGELGVQR